MKKYYYKLGISPTWYIWEPKKGRYAGKTKYICKITSFTADNYYGIPVIIAGFNNKGTHMHVGSVTQYQLNNNTTLLQDQRVIQELEKKYKPYKEQWEKRRLAQTAKKMLLEL